MVSSISESLQRLKTFDPLTPPTEKVKKWLEGHPTAFRVVLIVNQLFRAGVMAGFMASLPYSMPINTMICLSGTLFYRLTIQGNCPYKLDMTALLGATSLLLAKDGVVGLIDEVACTSLKSCAWTAFSFLPLAFYAFYMILTSEPVKVKESCCR